MSDAITVASAGMLAAFGELLGCAPEAAALADAREVAMLLEADALPELALRLEDFAGELVAAGTDIDADLFDRTLAAISVTQRRLAIRAADEGADIEY